jgi:predicted DNA-binding transcriptional regulator YafY
MQHLDKKSINIFTNAYLNAYKSELINSLPSAHSEETLSEKVRLDQTNLKLLSELQEQDEFYGIKGEKFVKVYLKSVFEEYARLPSYKREQIYFKTLLSTIEDAIRNSRKLKIYLTAKYSDAAKKRYQRVFHVAPYKILQNKTNNYNYLVGYTQELKDGELLESRPSSFRLSAIADVHTLAGTSALTKPKKDRIEKAIRENEVEYLAGDTIEVIVRFTKKGLDNLKRQIYMRPVDREKLEETETHTTYSFVCTEVQATNYFFKFGKHAYIVEPAELREKFKKRYIDSYNTYIENEKEED